MISSTISWSIAANRKNAIAMTRCGDAGSRLKAKKSSSRSIPQGDEGLQEAEHKALKLFNLRGKKADELHWEGGLVSLTAVTDFAQVLGPDAKELGTLTPPREFNLMFKTICRRA